MNNARFIFIFYRLVFIGYINSFKEYRKSVKGEITMDINSFIEDIVKAEQKLNELKAYEEHRANDDITEAVLICCNH